jgi:murein DD-endopeptidase MepM/ murein hydrolase activator NlpD
MGKWWRNPHHRHIPVLLKMIFRFFRHLSERIYLMALNLQALTAAVNRATALLADTSALQEQVRQANDALLAAQQQIDALTAQINAALPPAPETPKSGGGPGEENPGP